MYREQFKAIILTLYLLCLQIEKRLAVIYTCAAGKTHDHRIMLCRRNKMIIHPQEWNYATLRQMLARPDLLI